MITLTDYTTYDDVRAAIGVAPEEIGDDVLGLSLYAYALEVDIDDVDSNLVSYFEDAIAAISPTVKQQALIDATKLFSTYSIARHLLSAAPLFAPKDITDGKATLNRIQDSHKLLSEGIEKLYGRFRTRLVDTLASFNSSTAIPATSKVYFGIALPDTDPVTGE